jgi:hypothetical protein
LLGDLSDIFTYELFGTVQAHTRMHAASGGFVVVAESLVEMSGKKASTIVHPQVRGQVSNGDVLMLPSKGSQ